MTDPTKVYCDNDELLQHIVSVHPSHAGLYPHEIAMLLYVSWGSFTTDRKKYSGTWKYSYFVEYPEELLKSLIQRGYVRESNSDEIIDCLRMKEIRDVLKKRGIKSGNTYEKCLEILKANMTTTEVYEECGFRYYVLTESGKKALDEQKIDQNDYANLWNAFIQDVNQPKLLTDQVTLIGKTTGETPVYELYIDSNNNTSRCILMVTNPVTIKTWRITEFPATSIVRIFIDGVLLAKEMEVDSYQILDISRKLIVGKNINNAHVLCRSYDLDSKNFCGKCEVDKNIYINGSLYEMSYQAHKSGWPDDGIIEPNRIIQYVSTCDGLTDEIILKYISKFAEISAIDPLIPGDVSTNYRISVRDTEYEIRDILMFMRVDGRLGESMVRGLPVHRIVRAMLHRSDNAILQSIFDNHCFIDKDEVKAVAGILNHFENNPSKVIEALETLFPYAVLCGHYGPGVFSAEHSYKAIQRNYEKHSKAFSDLLLWLKEEGIVDVKWVMEFNLYKLIKKKYDDCVFQCRFDWLGQQSLDIYIPSIKTAIEYQGQQHYEPVDFFGGVEHFQKTQERDARKRKLCSENGVNLIYWPYTVEVKEENIKRVLGENSLMPRFASNASG